jgi:primosomal protein N' (replication factor Y)
MSCLIPVLVPTPAHSSVAGALTYRSEFALAPGTLVRVPLGRREVLGVVWEATDAPGYSGDMDAIRPVASVLDGLAPLSPAWRELVGFAASYYQRAAGEVALAALPPQLRDLSTVQLARRLRRAPVDTGTAATDAMHLIAATPEQTGALAEFNANSGPFLLFGATGSGKTEVYLRAAAALLAREPDAQALVMVPEINLTPQLEARFIARFGAQGVVSLHSGMTPAQRLRSWLAAHAGQARIVLGTRMAVFASMPRCRLIVVDEEHDPSYKQQEGARYSARDLAVYRARLEGAKVLLASATPSLESWHQSRAAAAASGAPADAGGRYQRLLMPSRVGDASLPRVRLVDMNHQPARTVIAPPLLEAISSRVARGEQALVFLNRRGYAPVLHCADCGWKSECPHCSAFRVFHKTDRTLRCHHCGYTERVPRACPACGNTDIGPLGRGTQRLEEHLGELLAGVLRPDGEPVRIGRIDADSTRAAGALASQLAQVHAGEVDVLVGTQMIAKGHDFRRVTLVAAVNPDTALFSSDFRAPERLFSLMMQAGGRAGRDATLAAQSPGGSEMWIQTLHPQHPLFAALRAHDYPAFAQRELHERLQAGLPPFSFQALVRAEARTQEVAQAFLNAASAAASGDAGELGALAARVTLYPAVPMTVQRVANVERAQMLVECASRPALQRFLSAWQALLHDTRAQPAHRGLIRWAIDVDPLQI